jgi:hypothetical protein
VNVWVAFGGFNASASALTSPLLAPLLSAPSLDDGSGVGVVTGALVGTPPTVVPAWVAVAPASDPWPEPQAASVAATSIRTPTIGDRSVRMWNPPCALGVGQPA